MKFFALILSLSLMSNAFSCSQDGRDGFLPENNLRIPVGRKSANGGLSEAQFNNVIDHVSAVYSPIIAANGGKFQVERNWNDETVNAYAQQLGSTWRVSMFGGLARHETVTEDGFYLVICHEIGHHLGGAPVKLNSSWASNEGEADYFATLKCMRRVWNLDDNEEIVSKMDVPRSLAEACGRQHVWSTDVAVCIRSGMAGLSVSNLFQVLSNSNVPGKFDTPDPRVVSRTDDNHPAYQCRLDTYLQGALCGKSFYKDLSKDDETVGACHGYNGQKTGLRPLCWFKPSK